MAGSASCPWRDVHIWLLLVTQDIQGPCSRHLWFRKISLVPPVAGCEPCTLSDPSMHNTIEHLSCTMCTLCYAPLNRRPEAGTVEVGMTQSPSASPLQRPVVHYSSWQSATVGLGYLICKSMAAIRTMHLAQAVQNWDFQYQVVRPLFGDQSPCLDVLRKHES